MGLEMHVPRDDTSRCYSHTSFRFTGVYRKGHSGLRQAVNEAETSPLIDEDDLVTRR